MPWSDWQDGFAYAGTAAASSFRQLQGPSTTPPTEWFEYEPIPTYEATSSTPGYTALGQGAVDAILGLTLRDAVSFGGDGGIRQRISSGQYAVKLGATEHVGRYAAGLPTGDPPGLGSVPHGVNPDTGSAVDYEAAVPVSVAWGATTPLGRTWSGVGPSNDAPVPAAVHVDFDLLLLDHFPAVGDSFTDGTVLASISFDATPANTPAFNVAFGYPSVSLSTTDPVIVLAEAPRFLRTGTVTGAVVPNTGVSAQRVVWNNGAAVPDPLTFSAMSPRWRYWIPEPRAFWGVRLAG